MDIFQALPAQWQDESTRLVFRLAQPSDGATFYPQWQDPVVARQLGMVPAASLSAVQTKLGYDLGQAQIGAAGRYVVVKSGRPVGIVGFNDIDQTDARTEIGYEVLPEFQGQGLGRRIVAAMVRQAWGALSLNRVSAGVLPDNLASQKVLTHNHFTQEGRLRQFQRIGDQLTDLIVFSKVKNLDA